MTFQQKTYATPQVSHQTYLSFLKSNIPATKIKLNSLKLPEIPINSMLSNNENQTSPNQKTQSLDQISVYWNINCHYYDVYTTKSTTGTPKPDATIYLKLVLCTHNQTT